MFVLVGLVAGQQGSIDWLHAAWTGEAAHQPVIDAALMISMHAGQVTDGVAHNELHHAYHTLPGLFASIIGASG